ncbi:MAG: penicillin-binding protein activator, partial [Alphaproteobacteria bacterium]|nr:penicillin-binding protein activator [Alphaproteobacteria bacterium]
FGTWSLSFVAALLLAGCGTTIEERKPQKQEEAQRKTHGEADSLPPLTNQALVSPKGASATMPVALLLPLTGARSKIGQSLKKVAELALFDQPSETLTLVFKDTKSTSEGAKAAFHEIIDQGIDATIGPVFSDEVRAISPLARSKGRYLLTLSNDTALQGGGVYVLGLTPKDQIQSIVVYARTHDLKNVGVLIPRNTYGDLLEGSLKQALSSLRLGPVPTARYNPNGDDLGIAMDALSIQNLDALLVLEGEKTLARVSKFLETSKDTSHELQLLGVGALDSLAMPSDPKVIGVIYAGVAPGARAVLNQRFESVFQEKPERIATVLYDALTYLSKCVSSSTRIDASKTIELKALSFEGFDGPMTITSDGAVQRSYSILEITKEGAKVIASPFKENQ